MIDDLAPDQYERSRRSRPGTSGNTGALGGVSFRLSQRQHIAPNLPSNHNTLKLGTWVEAKIVTNRLREIDRIPIFDERTPIKNELCLLFVPDGTIREARTNNDGVVRFDGLPIASSDGSAENVMKPGLVLPEILEEWVGDSNPTSAKPAGNFGKNRGERDDYRQRDGCVHFVPVMTPEFEICVNNLTEEQKYRHIRQAYSDHRALYGSARPHIEPTPGNHARWEWGRGAECNEHVNFFLGYWFNFNSQFTYDATKTTMGTIMAYDSSAAASQIHPNHRGYREFLEPITGFGPPAPRDPARGHPSGADYNSHYLFLDYIRIDHRFFDRTQHYRPTAKGNALIAALADFNVYSVSNLNQKVDDKNAVVNALQNHGYPAATVATAGDIIWDLDENVPDDYRLIHVLENLTRMIHTPQGPKQIQVMNWDHHGGILMKRGTDLFTFSADGDSTHHRPIDEKPFGHSDMSRWFFHLAISKIKPLRNGGFSPEEVSTNTGQISIDEPPRFIDWS